MIRILVDSTTGEEIAEGFSTDWRACICGTDQAVNGGHYRVSRCDDCDRRATLAPLRELQGA